jgi:ssDNA-binding Zn-finger/Zn-ribbon topoisomerase 1
MSEDRKRKSWRAIRLDEAPEMPERKRPRCATCKAPMVVRRSKDLAVFWGCAQYPRCAGYQAINHERWVAYVTRRLEDTKGRALLAYAIARLRR